MTRTMEYRTRERIINEGATPSDDPRLDAPEIKVTYPPEEIEDRSDDVQTTNEPPQPVPSDDPRNEVKDDHVCTVSVQKAFEQNWVYFTIIALAVFGLGYLLGKSTGS